MHQHPEQAALNALRDSPLMQRANPLPHKIMYCSTPHGTRAFMGIDMARPGSEATAYFKVVGGELTMVSKAEYERS